MKKIIYITLLLLFVVGMIACGEEETAVPTLVPTAVVPIDASTAAPAETAVPLTPTPVPPTPTPAAPLAAEVDGVPVYLADFEQELARYEQGLVEMGQSLDAVPDRAQVVLDAMIERQLILNAAAAAGVEITAADIDAELELLRAAAGEEGNFEAWLAANLWTEEAFREELRATLAQERMVAQVTTAVPAAVEQVRARYMQLDDSDLASTLAAQLQNGDDFATLAQLHSRDRVTGELGGDLGFFGRGVLLVPEVEEAAFALQNPGDVSELITATNGDGQTVYYLVQLVERDPARPLPAELLMMQQQETFYAWLDGLWATASIERYIE